MKKHIYNSKRATKRLNRLIRYREEIKGNPKVLEIIEYEIEETKYYLTLAKKEEEECP